MGGGGKAKTLAAPVTDPRILKGEGGIPTFPFLC